MRVRRGASCKAIPRVAGQRCGCRHAIRKSLEVPGQHRPIPATSISSAPSISMPQTQICTAILTAHRARSSAMHGQPRTTMQQLAQLEAVVGSLWRPARILRMGLFASRPGWPAGTSLRSRHRRHRSNSSGLLACSLRHCPKTEQRLENHRPRPAGKDSPHRGHRRHLLPGWSRAQSAIHARPPWRQCASSPSCQAVPTSICIKPETIASPLFDRIAAEMYRVARPNDHPR